jgi:membrane protease YdiL (CAAX protease family)
MRTVWVGLLVNAAMAIGEETVFRGYLLTGLTSVIGKWRGLLLMTTIFGAFHVPAYIAAGLYSSGFWLALVLASLFGGLFGLVYLRRGTLWLPVSLHFAWNFMENDLLSLTSDSGNPHLIGAITRLRVPSADPGLGLGNVIAVEMIAASAIAAIVWLWVRSSSQDTDALPVFLPEGAKP